MQIETPSATVVQLLLKGEDYDELCPNDEDTWYNLDEVENNKKLKELLSPQTLSDILTGKIDYVVCRGNW